MQKNKQDFIPKLIFLCLITTSIVTTFTLSKYQSTIAMSNNASVAAFVVDAESLTGNSQNIILDCKNSNDQLPFEQYKIRVTNTINNKTSAVAMRYSIVINLPDELPEGVNITVSDADTALVSNNNKTYTFKSNNMFSPGINLEYTHIITFSVSDNLIGNHTLNGINISVVTEQID